MSLHFVQYHIAHSRNGSHEDDQVLGRDSVGWQAAMRESKAPATGHQFDQCQEDAKTSMRGLLFRGDAEQFGCSFSH